MMTRKIYLLATTLLFLFSMSFVMPIQDVSAQNKKQLAQAKKLAEEGDQYFRQKKYRLAIASYEKASAIVPKVPALYFYKGYAHYNLEENDEALEALGKAFDLGYSPIEVYKVRWYILYLKKDFDSALADLEAAIKLKPDDSTFLIAAGDVYREKKMNKEAVDLYEKAALIVPENADLHYFIAYTYAQLGDFVPQGVAALKAIQKGTRYLGDSWYLVGNSFQRERKYAEAAEAYEKAVSAKPEIVGAFSSLAQIYQILNRFDDAISAVKKGLLLNPEDGNLYISLSWFYSLINKNMDAIGAAKKAINILPNESMGYTNLCRAYNDIKEYDLAIQSCNKALALNPNDGETNFYLARSYAFLKRNDTAAIYYKKSVPGLIEYTQNNPDLSDGFYLLGNAYGAVEQIPKAISAYKQCLALSPKFTKAIYNLGYMYVLNSDKASARIQYDELLKLDPDLAKRLLETIQQN